MKTMSAYRPAFLLASLGAATPSVVLADGMATTGGDRPVGDASGLLHGLSSSSLAVAIAAVLLLGVAMLMLTGRINWRLGAIAIVGACALFAGDAMMDGASTAIAVSL